MQSAYVRNESGPARGVMGYQHTPFFRLRYQYTLKCKKVHIKYLKLKNTDVTPLYTEYQEFREKILYTHILAKKIPNSLVKNTQDTVYPKPLAGPDESCHLNHSNVNSTADVRNTKNVIGF